MAVNQWSRYANRSHATWSPSSPIQRSGAAQRSEYRLDGIANDHADSRQAAAVALGWPETGRSQTFGIHLEKLVVIRFIHCMKRRSDVSLHDFRAFLASEAFDRLVAELAVQTSAVRWSKTVTLAIAANVELMAERGSEEPFDAVLEVWWQSSKDLEALVDASHARQLLAEMQSSQSPYVDFHRSVRFFTDWDEA